MELTIVKWVADDVRKTWAAGAVQHGSVQAAQVPQVPPASNQFNLTSPSVEVSDEDDMEMLPEDYVLLLERTPIWELPDDDDLEAEERLKVGTRRCAWTRHLQLQPQPPALRRPVRLASCPRRTSRRLDET
eukprot:g24482.t1